MVVIMAVPGSTVWVAWVNPRTRVLRPVSEDFTIKKAPNKAFSLLKARVGASMIVVYL